MKSITQSDSFRGQSGPSEQIDKIEKAPNFINFEQSNSFHFE